MFGEIMCRLCSWEILKMSNRWFSIAKLCCPIRGGSKKVHTGSLNLTGCLWHSTMGPPGKFNTKLWGYKIMLVSKNQLEMKSWRAEFRFLCIWSKVDSLTICRAEMTSTGSTLVESTTARDRSRRENCRSLRSWREKDQWKGRQRPIYVLLNIEKNRQHNQLQGIWTIGSIESCSGEVKNS